MLCECKIPTFHSIKNSTSRVMSAGSQENVAIGSYVTSQNSRSFLFQYTPRFNILLIIFIQNEIVDQIV